MDCIKAKRPVFLMAVNATGPASKEVPETYNQRVQEFINKNIYQSSDLIIVDRVDTLKNALVSSSRMARLKVSVILI